MGGEPILFQGKDLGQCDNNVGSLISVLREMSRDYTMRFRNAMIHN